MEAADFDAEFDSSSSRGRARRALASIAASLVAITAVSLVFLHPILPSFGGTAGAGTADYRVAAVDFIDRSTGWVVAVVASGEYAVMHTSNGGLSWTRQLSLPSGGHAHYLKFFDRSVGLFGLVGTRPLLHLTSDGGRTWLPLPAQKVPGTVLSWSFVDSDHGWMLVNTGRSTSAARLYRTVDGGHLWTGIGATVRSFPPLTVRAFDGGRLRTFTYTTLIDQVAGGPYAQDQAPNQTRLRTVDNGTTWAPIEPPSTSGAIGYFDASNWWWIGAGLRSTSRDGGVTWSGPSGVGVIGPTPGSLQVLDRNDAWFAGSVGAKPVLVSTNDGALHWRTVAMPPIEELPTP